jgi:23S rRNA pseudouridine1911/1915/1917 synthase
MLKPGNRITILPADDRSDLADHREMPEFRILFEDDDLVVVDKPAGLVVHPGPGRPSGTLMDALIVTRPDMMGVGDPGRWGIVHRLDRDTSGVMVTAKTAYAHAWLSARFKEHSTRRMYLALVRGNPGKAEGTVDAAIGRHGRDRKRVSTATKRPRPAVTRWRVLQRYGGLTLLEVFPETGRTHQIRVHLAYAGLPVAGDPVYGRTRKSGDITDPFLVRALKSLKRQALHAAILGFFHPRSFEYVEFSSPLPADIALAVSMCEKACQSNG